MKNIKKFFVTIVFTLLIFIICNISFDFNLIFNYIVIFILILIPFIIEYKFKLKVPLILELIYVTTIIFIYIGEKYSFYYKFSWWDNIIHLMSGFVLVSVFFSILKLKLKKSKYILLISIFSFSLSMIILVSWEIFEYLNDFLFNKNMLKYALYSGKPLVGLEAAKDTLTDLSMDMISSILTSTILYFLTKYKFNLKNYLLIQKNI